MLSISKTSKHKYLAKIIAIIILIHKENKLYMQISNYLKLVKYTVIFIIHHYNRQPKYILQPTK